MKAGCNLNSIGIVGGEMLTPLMVALKVKNEEMVRLLVLNGVDPRFVDPNGVVYSPFEYSEKCGAQSLKHLLNSETHDNKGKPRVRV
jgi:hypothetical protein